MNGKKIKDMMNNEVGFGRNVLRALEKSNISFEHMPSGVDSITLILKHSVLKEGQLERVVEKIKSTVKTDEVSVEADISLILVVGEKLLHNIGIAARTTAAFGREGINIKMLTQGASEISMVFAIDTSDCKRAVRALYNEFFNS